MRHFRTEIMLRFHQLLPMRIYRYVRNRWFHQTHVIDTGLMRGYYHDYVEMMIGALLEIVDGYVSRDKEDAFSTVNWEHNDEVNDLKAKIIDILRFKYITRVEMQKKLDDAGSEFSKNFLMKFDNGKMVFEGDEQKRHELLDRCLKLENELEQETQRVLHEIVDVRLYLWT
jgi:hypothetical protein